MKKAGILLAMLILFSGCARDKTKFALPALISDNMLIQQKSDVKFWGRAAPGKKIHLVAGWNETGSTVADEEGRWSLTIPSPEPGGPYELTISARDTSVTVKNILVGEVWVCSGQSNMEMPLAGWPPNDTIMHSAEAIASADLPSIRLFIVQRMASGESLEDCSGRWEVCSPSSVGQFSATAYFFGKKLHDELNIPVGLIESAWGGTPAEAWISGEALENEGEFLTEIKAIRESAPLLAEYQSWLNSHKQFTINQGTEDQWKNLPLGDEKVALPDFDDKNWPVMTLPGQFERVTGDFDGTVWFRKEIVLPPEMEGEDLVLNLGPIDDMDVTYFNGALVGSHEESGFYLAERIYSVSGGLVRAGANTIAVRVLDNQGGGGIWGRTGSMKLLYGEDNSKSIDIEGDWKYQPAAELVGNRFFILDPSANEYMSVQRPRAAGPYSPTALYNGMINPLVSYRVKGAIWYQGESNVGRDAQYSRIFPLLIRNWRDSWENSDMPFYFVQIAPYVYSGVDSAESAFLREAQEKALQLPNTGMVTTLDLATVFNIHPPFKKEVGERLANIALAKDYGRNIVYQGPVFKSAIVDGKAISVGFDFAEDGLKGTGAILSEFEIAGEDMKYVKADARIAGDEVIVSSSRVGKPVFVRYCWRNGASASLFNSAGLPAHQFRMD